MIRSYRSRSINSISIFIMVAGRWCRKVAFGTIRKKCFKIWVAVGLFTLAIKFHFFPVTRQLNRPDVTNGILCHNFTKGRFGNHLFEYASMLGLAYSNKKRAVFENLQEMKIDLKVPPSEATEEMKERCKKAKEVYGNGGGKFERDLMCLEPKKDFYVDDHLQSWMYFDGIRNEIKEALTFNDSITSQAKTIIQELRSKHLGVQLIGVHVRRGDLLTAYRVKEGYKVASPAYFKKALSMFRIKFLYKTLFVVMGQDRDWSMANIKPVNNDVLFPISSKNAALDMEVLSRMDHIVLTCGTFGWWSAFKNHGQPLVTFMQDFVKEDSDIGIKWYSSNRADFLMPSWIAIPDS